MLQALSDLFLLISSDTKRITNQDLLIFYTFIIKKMPKIEQQFPLMITKSLSNHLSQNAKREDNKKLFFHFQKQIFSLFSELIQFCYEQKIIKLNNKIEKILFQLKSNNSQEAQKFLNYLVINNKVDCTIYPNDYVKFFNTENKNKNRIYAERFLNYSKNLIKIYKENNNKKQLKRIINTEKKVSKSEKIIMPEEKNQTLGNKKNEELVMGIGRKFFEEKKFEILSDKIRGNQINSKKKLNINTSKNISSTDNEIIENNDAEYSSDCNKSNYIDENNDTLCCQTPKDAIINDIEKNYYNSKNDKIFFSQRNTYMTKNKNNKNFIFEGKHINQSQNLLNA